MALRLPRQMYLGHPPRTGSGPSYSPKPIDMLLLDPATGAVSFTRSGAPVRFQMTADPTATSYEWQPDADTDDPDELALTIARAFKLDLVHTTSECGKLRWQFTARRPLP